MCLNSSFIVYEIDNEYLMDHTIIWWVSRQYPSGISSKLLGHKFVETKAKCILLIILHLPSQRIEPPEMILVPEVKMPDGSRVLLW